MTDQLSITDHQPEVILSLHEAAEYCLLTYSALIKWFNTHKDMKDKYLHKQKHNGRMVFTVSPNSLHIMSLVKSGTRSNQHVQRGAELHFTEQKQVVAENYNQMAELMKDPIIAFRIDQIKMQKDINSIRQELDNVKQLTIDAPPVGVTDQQRAFFVDRVRNYARETEVPYNVVFTSIHRIVGKYHVEEYTFMDYKVGLRNLKAMYTQKGIDW